MIRHAHENDLPAILAIYNDAILTTTTIYEDKVQTLSERQEWYLRKKTEKFPVIICESNQQVIGFATFATFKQLSGFTYTTEDSVYVHSNYRCKGVGTTLLKKLIEIANHKNYVTMIAEIDNANKSSILMHEKVGFRQVGIIPKAGYKFKAWHDLAIYHCDLTSVC